MTARQRDWVMTLVAACLLIALACVIPSWTIPRLLSFATSTPGLIVAGWWIFVALVIVLIGRSAARGDSMADSALERQREMTDWKWPDRDMGVGRSS